MNKMSIRLGLVMALMVLMTSGRAKAGLDLATDYDPSTNFNTNPGQPVRFDAGTYGYSFTVGNAPLSVTTLATAYAGAQGTVHIYELGSNTDIATAFITGAQVDTSQHGNPFGYTAIAPVTLNANTTYGIVWDDPFFGQAYSPLEPGYSYNPDITFGVGLSSFTVGDHPTADAAGQGAYFGPSLVVRPVPEPSSIACIAIGGLTALGYGRRRRKAKATA